MKAVDQARKRLDLLYQSSLMNLTNTVELFFSQLLHIYFHQHPEAVSTRDKIFSFEDLTGFNTVDDARKHYINCRVEDLLYKSFSDWVDFLKDKPKLSMSYLDKDLPRLKETFLRRNLVVHNGGIINSVYLSKVSQDLVKGMSLGERIRVDRDYLNDRVDLFERNCILIAAELWKKMCPADTERADMLISTTYVHLLQKRWPVAESLSYFLMQDKQMPEAEQLIGKVNYWLAKKRQGQWSEIKTEIEAADFSAKSLKFQLALASLREELDQFFDIAPRAIQAEDISLDALNEFPIFDEVRGDERFIQYRPVNTNDSEEKSDLAHPTALESNGLPPIENQSQEQHEE